MLDPVAQLDQIQAEMRALANMMAQYHRDIIATSAFTDEQAFQLVQDWHLNYWQTIHTEPADNAGHDAPTFD